MRLNGWLAAGAAAALATAPGWAQRLELAGRLNVTHVWSGCPVGFAMLTHPNRQFLAFYDADRVMTLAQRDLPDTTWTFAALPSRLGWDSHNCVTLAVDRDGFLHVSGNMHCAPLVYFRSTRPLDIHSMQPLHRMTGAREERVTYPRFMNGPDGALLFTWRDGGSGNGATLWARYDAATRKWSPLTPEPLFDGQGRMNAYPHGPVRGPDGRFHLSWVWRDTPDCETCHDICYARSRDMVHWENAAGKPLTLPVRAGADVVVDPVPARGGLINPCQAIGFDAQGRAIVSYTKHDAAGNTQLCNARWEDGAWRVSQASDWNHRWDFSGRGSIICEIGVGAVEAQDGTLAQSYSHATLGGGRWALDPATLKPTGPAEPWLRYPAEVGRNENPHPGMQLRTAADLAADPTTGRSPDGFHYRAVWESLPPNRDRPQPGPIPPASILRVYQMRAASDPR